MRPLQPFALLASLILVAACDLAVGTIEAPTESGPRPFDDACAAYGYSAALCARWKAWAIEQGGALGDPATQVQVPPPDPPCGPHNGQVNLCKRSGMDGPWNVLVVRSSGDRVAAMIPCAGIPDQALCFEVPRLQAQSPSYWDTPEGASPVPAPDADAVAKARPLRIANAEIDVGPAGHREVEIGRAWLPNGILSEADYQLVDEFQRGYLIDHGIVALTIVPADPSRPPFDSIYSRGRLPGIEEVRVLLVFDVKETSQGASFRITNVDVH